MTVTLRPVDVQSLTCPQKKNMNTEVPSVVEAPCCRGQPSHVLYAALFSPSQSPHMRQGDLVRCLTYASCRMHRA